LFHLVRDTGAYDQLTTPGQLDHGFPRSRSLPPSIIPMFLGCDHVDSPIEKLGYPAHPTHPSHPTHPQKCRGVRTARSGQRYSSSRDGEKLRIGEGTNSQVWRGPFVGRRRGANKHQFATSCEMPLVGKKPDGSVHPVRTVYDIRSPLSTPKRKKAPSQAPQRRLSWARSDPYTREHSHTLPHGRPDHARRNGMESRCLLRLR
jgi:hypothetical protein